MNISIDGVPYVPQAEVERLRDGLEGLRWALTLIADGHIAPKTLAKLTLDGPR